MPPKAVRSVAAISLALCLAAVIKTPAVAQQQRSTFSGSALQGLGTGTNTGRTVEPPILTADTLDAWIRANIKKATGLQLKAAERGVVAASVPPIL